MSEKETIKEYALVNNTYYGSASNVIFNIRCTESEIEEVVRSMNYFTGKYNGKLSNSIGTPDYYTWRRTTIFNTKEEFDNFINERKKERMEELALRDVYNSLW